MRKRLAALFCFPLTLALIGCSPLVGVSATPSPLPVQKTTTLVEPTPTLPPQSIEDPYLADRQEMVASGILAWGIKDQRVVEVMAQVPRHLFVPKAYLHQAYANHPLPIGYGQTISQPYIVALMTEALGVSAGDKVLEIGTGSGYQAAVLAELGAQVYTMEIIGPLAAAAEQRLAALGYADTHVRHADGYFGWPEQAPFDAIIVTAAPDHVPHPLVGQLKVGGVMVIPIGPVGGYQELWSITRVNEDQLNTVSLGGVSFVPFTRASDDE